jgi:hypothetical protein
MIDFAVFLLALVGGILLGLCLYVVLEDRERSDPYVEAELDAMEAVDRLFDASEQARQDMRAEKDQRSSRRSAQGDKAS